MDEHSVPQALRPWSAALSVSTVRTYPHGYRADRFVGAPFVATPGLPPHDGIHRASFVDPCICIRFDLSHSDVPERLAECLRAAHPEAVGTDGALYIYARDTRSQHRNRGLALERLAAWLDLTEP